MTRPWLEEWRSHRIARVASQVITSSGAVYNVLEEHRELIAAAPALMRALLMSEWAPGDAGFGCRACRGGRFAGERGHGAGCPVDAALTAVGLPDQERRDGARAEIARMVRRAGPW